MILFRTSRLLTVFGSLLLAGLFLGEGCSVSYATPITPASARTIIDSEESYGCRVYSYDMGVDSKGNVHIVYSKPLHNVAGDNCPDKAEIYYVRRLGSAWQAPVRLSANGRSPSISTLLNVGRDDRIHICYIADGSVKTLHYITVNNGVPGVDITVDDGGWHTRMQLDDNDRPMFAREKWDHMALLRTDDGVNWTTDNYLDLPSVPQFRIADFVYENGRYHLTYGGYEHTREVWDSAAQTTRVMEPFHDLHYAFSADGIHWTTTTVDSSVTLHNRQFWTSLAVDRGTPLISMYKYNETGGRYNYGTSANLMTVSGGIWSNRIITDQSKAPNTLEGMGPGLAVNAPGDYFAAWDFSPDYEDIPDYNFQGQYGNIALVRNGPKNDWTSKAQLDPFSLEGRALLLIKGGKLYFLGLGDWHDAKLYFRDYYMSELDKILPPSSPGTRKGVPAVYLLLQEH
jgi:hypothetical protein